MRSDLPDLVADLYERLATLERRLANQRRKGTIHEVDTAKKVARVSLGESADGKLVLSPWVPWQAPAMGAFKINIPPSVGEQVTIESDSGDMTDAVINNSLRSNANPMPDAKSGEAHMTNAGFKLFVDEAGKVVIESSVAIVLKAPTINLGDEGGELVHRVGDQDSAGHAAVGSATRVYAV
jgi:phage baseplate assembly protein V